MSVTRAGGIRRFAQDDVIAQCPVPSAHSKNLHPHASLWCVANQHRQFPIRLHSVPPFPYLTGKKVPGFSVRQARCPIDGHPQQPTANDGLRSFGVGKPGVWLHKNQLILTDGQLLHILPSISSVIPG
jgi:hypothetical protein